MKRFLLKKSYYTNCVILYTNCIFSGLHLIMGMLIVSFLKVNAPGLFIRYINTYFWIVPVLKSN